jgi:hypothetical protein
MSLGVKSAMRPSRRRDGNGRSWLVEGASLVADVSRASLPMLPPDLQHVRKMLDMNKGFYEAPHVSFAL